MIYYYIHYCKILNDKIPSITQSIKIVNVISFGDCKMTLCVLFTQIYIVTIIDAKLITYTSVAPLPQESETVLWLQL